MWKNIFEFLVVAFLLCGWESVFLLTNNNFPYVIPHFDHTDYSTISQFLNLTGEENAFRESNFYDEAFTGLIPYHYFELWLNAAIAKCFGLLYSTSLLLITYPLFYFLFYLGVNAIWEEFGTISFYKKILSFLFLFFGAFCFPFFEKLPFINQYFYGLVIKSYPVEFLAKKMICIYIFIIPAFLCMVRKYFSTGFLFILCIPVVFAATAPGILAGSFIFLLLVYFLKLISPREIKKTFLYLFVFSVFFFLLYKTSGNHVFLTVEGNIFDLFTTENSALKKQWADVVWLAQTLPFQIILAYLPFIIIFFLFLFSGNKIKMFSEFRSIALIVFVTIIAGGITWAVLLPIPDSFQFYSSVMTFLNMLCIFILVKIFSTQEVKPSGRKIVSGILYGALILQLIVAFKDQWQRKQEMQNMYSSGYVLKIQELKNEIKNPVGVCLYSNETPMLAPYRIQAGLYLKFMDGFENLINISVLDREYLNPNEKHHLKSSLFYRYVMKQKSTGKFKDIEQSQLDFIKELKIDYVVAQKNSSISNAILEHKKEIITDPQSGEKFILLN